MLTWNAFAHERPDLAAAGRRLFYQHGLGLGFLATVRPDGGPRVHPICPIMTQDALYAMIVPGPKLRDLRRDSRYALHSETCAPPHHDDACYLTGTVVEKEDTSLFARLKEQMLAERGLSEPWPGFDEQTIVEFLIDGCLVTLTLADEGLPAGHTVWHSGRA